MTTGSVRVATTHDVERLVAPVALAFATDPVVRYLLPDAGPFLSLFPKVVRLHAETVVSHSGLHCTEDLRGAALWYPPGVHVDAEALAALWAGSLAEARLSVIRQAFERMSAHEPDEPHMYLRIIGVDPVLQGRGYGSSLLRFALEAADRQGVRAYLEASSEASRALYERHGFTTEGEIRIADAPPLWPMLRPAGS